MYTSRIVEIRIKGLFNKFDYSIDLRNESDIAVLIAANGRGKTTIFNLLNFIFSPSIETFELIRSIPFEEFTCNFDSCEQISLHRYPYEVTNITFASADNITSRLQTESTEFLLQSMNGRSIGDSSFPQYYNYTLTITKRSQQIKQIDFMRCLTDGYSEFLKSGLDYFEKNSDTSTTVSARESMLGKRFGFLFDMLRKTLEESKMDINIMFISTSRIYPSSSNTSSMHNTQADPLTQAKREIDRLIQNSVKQYNENKARAINELTKEFISYEARAIPSSQDHVLQDFNQDLDSYIYLGLLRTDEKIDLSSTVESTNRRDYLKAYLEKNRGNTQPFKEISAKFSMLKKFFDARNEDTGKRLSFTQDGLKIYTENNSGKIQEISLSHLSSGEKHDFIMLYKLIFSTKPYSLVLIDEPEISLHITWQEEYLDNLIEICGNNMLQALVATHSPNIINGHFELMAEIVENE